MLPVFRKEINGFFSSSVAYVIMAVFLTAVGLMVWVFPDTSLLEYGYANMGVFFNLTPYVMLFLIPAITMRSIAEEVRTGTIEWLLTKPLTRWQLILAKFVANWLLVVLLLLPTLVYYYSVYQLGNPPGNIDSASVFGSYVGLLLLGGVFVAIGLFASSINENQVVAFVIGVFLCFLLYVGISSVASLEFWGSLSYPLTWIALDEQYQALGRGLIDSRNVIYLVSVITVFLYLTEWRMTALTR
ncbi:gliding motility-associated ABC transporter permease subunit GldF [Larkinella arboricola]